jgi:hypothetical protein
MFTRFLSMEVTVKRPRKHSYFFELLRQREPSVSLSYDAHILQLVESAV